MDTSGANNKSKFDTSFDYTGTVTAGPPAMTKIPSRETWPEPPRDSIVVEPLRYDKWSGPYKNDSGEKWVNQIDAWYTEGSAAGLHQDTFRSFDNGHSSLRTSFYPQLISLEPVESFGQAGANIFPERVTLGVQSYGITGMSVVEKHSLAIIRGFYEGKFVDIGFQKFYEKFYEYNFLFVAPAVDSFSDAEDKFSFLSPYYLHSVGASGTDAALLKPLVYAAAALPPDVKTRALRTGRYVPTLMYLFKSSLPDGIKSPSAHLPAYTLPEEAGDDWSGSTPFLDKLLNSAHGLTHIPPVCCVDAESASLRHMAENGSDKRAYLEVTKYGITGTLRKGQEFVFVLSLGKSWTDGDRPLREFHASVLRGTGTITRLNDSGSRLQVQIPWLLTHRTHDFRTDILLLVNDGSYYSAPAYISIRHIHELDPIVRGIKVD